MKKILVFGICLLLVFAGYLAYTSTAKDAPVASAKSTATYEGTVYVAGMGGHFAKAHIKIDPSNTENPITVTSLDKIDIGTAKTHPTHDPRIDDNDRTKMYWSTYKVDKTIKDGRTLHVGETDLTTGKKTKDLEVKLDPSVKWYGAIYCASGQTKDDYIDVTMTNPAYIDVRDKKTLELKHRVFLDGLGYDNNYFFYHGTNSPDYKAFVVTINRTEKWAKPDAPAARSGKVDMLLLDLPSLVKGKVKVLAKNTVSASPGGTGPTESGTFTFRQYYTPDGKYILQSGADRFYLFDAKNLKLLDREMMNEGENHDAIGTPDSKYAVLTLRTPGENQDGTLQLYDINAKKLVGKSVSVCSACHSKMGMHFDAALCGVEANWK
ncbi:MAG: hypothetical protein P8Y39_10290 [Nitrospirota bacterium]|jgi:hypothetical protein